MEEEKYREIAKQLRKPSGTDSAEVAHIMNKGNELLNRNTITQLKLKSNSTVVEIGMGNGKFVEELLQDSNIAKYVGCDYSLEMVTQATELNARILKKKAVSFVHCSADLLPFLDSSIDAIFTVNTIYFWDNPTVVLAEFKRVLKNNGQLVVGLRPEYLMKNYPFVKYGFKTYSSQSVEQLFLANGLKNIECIEIEEPDFVTEEMTIPVRSLVVSCRNNKD